MPWRLSRVPPKSAIVADALNPISAAAPRAELDDLLKVRLDRFGNQLGRIERDQQVVMESLALFIRYQFMVTAPVPKPICRPRAPPRRNDSSFHRSGGPPPGGWQTHGSRSSRQNYARGRHSRAIGER